MHTAEDNFDRSRGAFGTL